MRYCNRCKVIIENGLDNCPLCQQKTLKRNETAENDFPLQKTGKEDAIMTITKILLFLFVVVIGTNVVLNVAFDFTVIWAPYTIVILFYAFLMLKTAIKSYKNIGTIVMINVYMLSIIGFILDLVLGFSRWSINYLIPILILSGIIALVIFIFLTKADIITYFVYMLIIAMFGLTLLVLLWLNIVTAKKLSIITAFISLIVIIWMFMFGDKKARNEFAKRFHF